MTDENSSGEQIHQESRSAVFDDFPYFAQIPQSLIRNPNISLPARLLYGIYHSYAQDKSLVNKPLTYVSQKTLACIMKCTVQSISNWTQELKESGWIKVQHRGWRSNFIYLHPKQKRRR